MGFSKVDGVSPADQAGNVVADVHERILDVVDHIEENQEKQEHKKRSCSMDNIAGLLALMQNNRNMDLPGLIALCKEKGYDKGFGGEGGFMFAILLLFLIMGGGWNRLGRNEQDQVAAAAGRNLQDIIAMYDKLGQMQSETNNNFARAAQDTSSGFFQLDTKICSAIAETIAAVNNQGDRVYNATRDVGDAIRDCCCTLQAKLAELGCKVDGLYGEVRISQERINNAIERSNCDITTRIANLEAKVDLNTERTQALIINTAEKQEKERLARRVAELEANANSQNIAKEAMAGMQAWFSQNYAFSRTPDSPIVNRNN